MDALLASTKLGRQAIDNFHRFNARTYDPADGTDDTRCWRIASITSEKIEAEFRKEDERAGRAKAK